ncbi:MAG: glycosyltransferase family 4 protein [Chloroflexi bacterium]|nr:glycosyltransferase family 4 protein [Chloroflexota bacterium]
MRISFVTPGVVWRPGGSYGVIFEYANQLTARGHEVRIVFPASVPQASPSADLGARLRARAVQLRKTWQRRISWYPIDPRVRLEFVPRLETAAIAPGDVVIATTWTVASFVASLPQDRGRGFYVVHHYEGGKYDPMAVDATLALPLVKLAVSRFTAREISLRGFAPVRYVPNGVDGAIYAPAEVRRSPLQVAMNFVPKAVKDPWTGIEALTLARERHPQLQAILFGTSRPPRGLPPWIQYARRLSTRSLVRDVYNRSSVFLCSSRLEGFGFPAAESMSCGCALVSTDCGGISEFARHGSTALLSVPGDAAALGENLARLIGDRALQERLVQAGRRAVGALTWQRTAIRLERALEEDVSGGAV